MLFVPKQSFSWSVTNMTGVWVDATFVSTTTPCGTNSKGAWSTALLSNTANDAYGIYVCFGLGAALGQGYLIDIGVDPANGTNYQVLIPDLMSSSGSATQGGMWWYFPLFIPRGSSVAARAQTNSGTTAIRVGVKLVGQPSRPDNIMVGSFVRAFNVNTATSYGTTAYTEGGTGTMGSYSASIGTTADRLWFWQCSWVLNNATWSDRVGRQLDIAVGDASNKYLVCDGMWCSAVNTERTANCQPQMANYFEAPSGVNIYSRGRHTAAALATIYAGVYGVGG